MACDQIIDVTGRAVLQAMLQLSAAKWREVCSRSWYVFRSINLRVRDRVEWSGVASIKARPTVAVPASRFCLDAFKISSPLNGAQCVYDLVRPRVQIIGEQVRGVASRRRVARGRVPPV
jgi:hypothetical protein